MTVVERAQTIVEAVQMLHGWGEEVVRDAVTPALTVRFRFPSSYEAAAALQCFVSSDLLLSAEQKAGPAGCWDVVVDAEGEAAKVLDRVVGLLPPANHTTTIGPPPPTCASAPSEEEIQRAAEEARADLAKRTEERLGAIFIDDPVPESAILNALRAPKPSLGELAHTWLSKPLWGEKEGDATVFRLRLAPADVPDADRTLVSRDALRRAGAREDITLRCGWCEREERAEENLVSLLQPAIRLPEGWEFHDELPAQLLCSSDCRAEQARAWVEARRTIPPGEMGPGLGAPKPWADYVEGERLRAVRKRVEAWGPSTRGCGPR